MPARFEELMSRRHAGELSPAEQNELASMLRGSEGLRRLAARDRLLDRLLRESHKPALNADGILQALPRTPVQLETKTMAALEQSHFLHWWKWELFNRRDFLAWALAGTVALLVLGFGAFWFTG